MTSDLPDTSELRRGKGGAQKLQIARSWAMPSPETFSVPPIRDFIRRWLTGASIDPFARNGRLATVRNDLNPTTAAEYHMDAADFCRLMEVEGRTFDSALFDPPYSPRQISEVYQSIGREVTGKDTQNAALYKRVRDALDPIVKPGGVVLSFGWNSAGMGLGRNYDLMDMLVVCHGGGHNDTICIAERKRALAPDLFEEAA